MTFQLSEYGFFVVRGDPSAVGPLTFPTSHFTPTTWRRLGPCVYVLISIACPNPNPSLRKYKAYRSLWLACSRRGVLPWGVSEGAPIARGPREVPSATP